MPTTPLNPDAAPAESSAFLRVARFVAVGQGGSIGVKFSAVIGRITIGGISSRIIRVGVALP